jgi:hypothetical protein
MNEFRRTGAITAVAAAVLFAAGTLALTSPAAQAGESVKCFGVNACKGQSQCRTAQSQCNGHNKCEGKGWIKMESVAACEANGGTAR